MTEEQIAEYEKKHNKTLGTNCSTTEDLSEVNKPVKKSRKKKEVIVPPCYES